MNAFNIDSKLAWIPIILYILWILYKGWYKIKVVFSNYIERSFIARVNAWNYLLSLAYALVGNWYILTYLPKTINTFLLTIPFGLILSIFVAYLPRFLYKKEITYMNNEQEKMLFNTLQESGTSSIWLSILVINANTNIFEHTNNINNIPTLAVMIIFYGLFIYRISLSEKKGNRISSELAISLINSRWYRRYVTRK